MVFKLYGSTVKVSGAICQKHKVKLLFFSFI